jgi:outer membrane protein OmpA-like peptidoglycan-associated protein
MGEKTRVNQKSADGDKNHVPAGTGKSNITATYDSPFSEILHLQRTIGNRAVTRLIQSGAIQATLRIGQPDDIYEQEADRVANQVMQMPGGSLARKESDPGYPGCMQEESGIIQTKPLSEQITPLNPFVLRQASVGGERVFSKTAEVSPDIASSIRAMKGRGASLSDSSRDFFEPRFESNFSEVRVHTNSQAVEAAGAVNAKAFTTGKDIFFAAGQYSPATHTGKRLLAHELTHVVQQGGSETYGGKVGAHTLQRQADISQAPGGLSCTLVTGSAAFEGSHLLFPISASNLNANHLAHITAFVNQWRADGATDDVQVDGYASVDGPQPLNWRLSCQRAESVERELISQGVPAARLATVAHGETDEFSATDLVRNRRSIISRHPPAAAAPPGAAPQLTATVNTGPNPVNCGEVEFIIDWSISGNSAAVNGGYVIQDITFTWDTRDCSGTTVPNPDPRRSPLRYFEAWRVDPNSRNFTVDGSGDRFFWPGNRPWAGADSTGNLTVMATAHYHDNVAALPRHMIVNNPRTFAGGLRSSLTDPALGGNVSQAVEHRLLTHWDCCPRGQRRATIVDGHTP